jgi:hypothetical protein
LGYADGEFVARFDYIPFGNRLVVYFQSHGRIKRLVELNHHAWYHLEYLVKLHAFAS